MKIIITCLISCFSVFILISLSYQPVIAEFSIEKIQNSDKTGKNSSWFPGWFFWNLKRFFTLIKTIILFLLKPILQPFYYLLLAILYIIFPH
jgi:hypothetical protein